MTRVTVREAPGAAPTAAGSGKVLLQLISPGQGSSGYYSPKVLQQAARDRVFEAGTHSYLDHPSESERYDRPERSVKDLVGVLTEDARWTGSALVASAQLFGEWAPRVIDMADAIGVSIRASAETAPRAGGGVDVTRLIAAESVDIVTKAGRGGRVLQVLESARPGSGRTGQVSEARLVAAAERAFRYTDCTDDRRFTTEEARDILAASAAGHRIHERAVTSAKAALGTLSEADVQAMACRTFGEGDGGVWHRGRYVTAEELASYRTWGW